LNEVKPSNCRCVELNPTCETPHAGSVEEVREQMTNYQSLSNDRLLELMYTEEDRLPRAAVDEFLRRGEEMVELLGEIAEDRNEWQYPECDQWAAVHATFILGAGGSEKAVPSLLKALRFASAYDNDLVSDELPAIFGKIGRPAMDGLRYIALDKTSDWDPRAVALSGLEAVAVNHPKFEDEVAAVLGGIFKNATEDPRVRAIAALGLLNLVRAEYKDQLIAYAREEAGLLPGDAVEFVDFDEDEVARAFALGRQETSEAVRDWLAFYSDEQIRERQERRRKEFGSDEFDDAEGDKAYGEGASSRGTFMLEHAKIGRNEPCPCGSGKKFKKCCLGQEKDDLDVPF